jgi:phage head maturation protease
LTVMLKKRKSNEINIQPLSRNYNIRSSSANEESRTFEAIAATETPVRMTPYWDDPFNEVLVMSGMRTERLDTKSVSFLKDHRSHSIDNVMGTVVSYRTDGGDFIVTIQMSEREEFSGVWADIRSGVLSNISVGYRVYKYREAPMVEGQDLPEYRAIDWEPFEVSLVAVQADSNSGVRSENVKENKLFIEGKTMKKEITPEDGQRSNDPIANPNADPVSTADNPPAYAGPSESERQAIAAAERKRISDIMAKGRSLGLGENVIKKYIDDNSTVEQASVRLIEEWAQNTPKVGGNNISVGKDETEKLRQGAVASLITRSGNSAASKDLSDEDREHSKRFAGMTMMEIAKDALTRSGQNIYGMSSMEIASRAISSHSTDFPIFLEGTARRVLLANFAIQPDTWRSFCTTGSVSDFREYKRVRGGTFSELEEVDENGEYKTKKITDGTQEKYSVKTYGNLINVSRKMLIDDDLGAFTDLAAKLGRAAALTIENNVYRTLQLNGGNGPLLADGSPLFAVSRNNISTDPGVPSTSRFEAMRVQVRELKDKDGNEFITVEPNVGLFPDAIRGLASTVNGSEYDHDSEDGSTKPNIVRGMLNEIIGTPRLTSKTAYYFFDPQNPVLQVTFLEGQETPFMESMPAFTSDGISWKIRQEHGVNGIDHVGAIKNAGA